MRGFRQRREAHALQEALERFENARAQGIDAAQARIDAGRDLGDLDRAFALATSMADASAEIGPDAAFARRVAMQLREAPVARRADTRRAAPRFRLAPLAAAAAVVTAALVLIPSFQALPGDPLYGVKGAAEDARVWFSSGPREARIRLSLANERFEEVEQLIANSRLQVMGGAPGVVAAGVTTTEIDDPELARLIEEALRSAGEQLEAAAEILTEAPAPKEDIDALVQVTTRGRTLATDVAEELADTDRRPVLRAAVTLAKVEAKAKAAQQTAEVAAEPSPTPCPTPSASASPSATPDDATRSPEASPTLTPPPGEDPATETASEEPAASPSATPCASDEATPSPAPTVEPEPSAAPTPTPGPDDQAATVDETDDGEPSSVSEEPNETHRRPLSPFGGQA